MKVLIIERKVRNAYFIEMDIEEMIGAWFALLNLQWLKGWRKTHYQSYPSVQTSDEGEAATSVILSQRSAKKKNENRVYS